MSMKEKLRILDQLEKKEITAEEAEKRLEALSAKTPAPIPQGRAGKSLRVVIRSSDGDNVNIQLPVNFARLILKGQKKFVRNQTLDNLDIDLEEVFEMVESGVLGELVNIESADGDTVRIFVE
ncbi:MAG: hypothetical protein EA374_02765 [Acholeplasmatales bacterium]|nr:MAG: hypothetical protein EA374_02765 [Acholeplasmatales bacterium]